MGLSLDKSISGIKSSIPVSSTFGIWSNTKTTFIFLFYFYRYFNYYYYYMVESIEFQHTNVIKTYGSMFVIFIFSCHAIGVTQKRVLLSRFSNKVRYLFPRIVNKLLTRRQTPASSFWDEDVFVRHLPPQAPPTPPDTFLTTALFFFWGGWGELFLPSLSPQSWTAGNLALTNLEPPTLI